MKITTRLSIQFTLIVAVILLFFSLLVFYFYYTSQITKFRENLLKRAKNTATLLLNVEEVDSLLLKKIHQSTISWEREEIAIIDSSNEMIYGNNIQYLTAQVIFTHSSHKPVRFFSILEKDGVYYQYDVKNKNYKVFVLAYDKSRKENLIELRGILIWSTLFSLWLSVLLSYLYSKKAIKPISKIIQNVKEIKSYKLNSRLDEGKKKDEIDQLAITFNEMLANLEIAFRNQEDFISNASHELRTPLSVMIGESDYFLSHQHNQEEYVEHIKALVLDLKEINVLLNSLLELAHVNRDINIPFSTVLIDDVILRAIHQVKEKYPDRNIVPKINYPEEGDDLVLNGNPGLLEIALKNLLDNACKFSNDDVVVELMVENELITISIIDRGVGIPKSEQEDIFKPFKRASNVKFISGYGIGLSLVSKIIELHNASISLFSIENEGTQIKIQYRRNV